MAGGLALGALASFHHVASVNPVDDAVDPSKWLKANKSKVERLAKDWWAARPTTRFEEWDTDKHSDLLAEARALGGLPEFDATNKKVNLDALMLCDITGNRA